MPYSILAYLLLKTFDIVNCNALCKFDLANFVETYLTLLHILLLVVAYWQALKNAWPKQVPKKYKFTAITSKLIIDFNVIIIAFKLDLLSFTYAIILFLKLYWSNKIIRFFCQSLLNNFHCSKKGQYSYVWAFNQFPKY